MKRELVCTKMVFDKRIDIYIHENIIKLQTEIHRDDLFKLVNLGETGYFKNKTADLVSYFGLCKNHQVVVCARERMKMNRYNELSAICTIQENMMENN